MILSYFLSISLSNAQVYTPESGWLSSLDFKFVFINWTNQPQVYYKQFDPKFSTSSRALAIIDKATLIHA